MKLFKRRQLGNVFTLAGSRNLEKLVAYRELLPERAVHSNSPTRVPRRLSEELKNQFSKGTRSIIVGNVNGTRAVYLIDPIVN